VCVLGYCILPLIISCLFMRLASLAINRLWFRFMVVGIALGWSIYGA
jgi:hypothetical protein